MNTNKTTIIPKGTTVRLSGCCNLVGTDEEFEVRILEEDTDIEVLNEEAYQMALEHFQVEGWVQVD